MSKTTTTFNLGWMLAEKGKRILLVDCDPQCNLTGMFLGFTGVEELEKVYVGSGVRNIRDGLAPAFESKPVPLEPVICQEMRGRPGLFLLPGHIGLAEYETTLGIAQELSGSLVTLQNLPGSISYLLKSTADKLNIDYIIVDMSPSLGPINQNLLSTSEYFLVPMAPDYFSVMAIDSLSSVLPKWKYWADKAKSMPVLQSATYPLPACSPRFLGTIIQRYRVRRENIAAAAFQKWIDDIGMAVRNRLIPALSASDMILSPKDYAAGGVALGEPILQMSDFNALIALSQKHNAPVFSLTDAQIEQTGIVLDRTKQSMENFRNLFSQGSDRIVEITNSAKNS